ncbi:jg21501 [Pararge aegeria aegeria]|uniref:Jg21501 protein n=1 Tax=Pararge aegeria aegeria TaxID=348720 RepID=A0A8S4RMC1_9NEOP|nr:jg21501 [Pararge aegeria aegeria]
MIRDIQLDKSKGSVDNYHDSVFFVARTSPAGAEGGMLGARLKSWMEAQLGRAKKRKQKQSRQPTPSTPVPPPHLSSPESAYSTGYSTDGTSPGAPPSTLAAPLVPPPPPPAPPTTHLYHEPAKVLYGSDDDPGAVALWHF